jgi:hypothetical protein
VYDGINTLEELDGNGAVVSRYTQTIGIDEPLAEVRPGIASFYQADGLGSITSISSAAASLAQTYSFNAFGNADRSHWLGDKSVPIHWTRFRFRNGTLLQSRQIL